MPTMIIPVSLLGVVPFLIFGLGAVGHDPLMAQRGLAALIDYAAVVLAFSGGIHWGLAMLPGALRPGVRIVAGVVPMLVAFVGVLLAPLVGSTAALAMLILGYLATVLTEHRAAQRFLMPSRYVWIRWSLSVVAVVVMSFVLIVIGLGQTFVF